MTKGSRVHRRREVAGAVFEHASSKRVARLNSQSKWAIGQGVFQYIGTRLSDGAPIWVIGVGGVNSAERERDALPGTPAVSDYGYK